MTLLSFLQRELAPTPGRLRASIPIVISALVAVLVTVTLGGDAFPHGHWTIITIFMVSQTDAGASLPTTRRSRYAWPSATTPPWPAASSER